MKGCGPFLHNDPDDRPEAMFGGKNTIHGGGKNPSFVLVPIIPRKLILELLRVTILSRVVIEH